jgi:hypothetical protein
MHKAASAYLGIFLGRVLQSVGYDHYDPVTEAFDLGIPADHYLASRADHFEVEKKLFGPFRIDTASHVANVMTARPIVHVRDVRDCIVSMYYSLISSHILPPMGADRTAMEAARNRLRMVDINEYVMEVIASDDLFARMRVLKSVCERRSDVVLSQYETMVETPEKWLDELCKAIGASSTDELRLEIKRAVSIGGPEDITQHKRQVRPGDFRRKLTQTTQAALTEFYRDELRYFGYS